jgi:glycosyltransferase domain-containing protein
MAKLLIPSRNRPSSLESWFSYVSQFYPGVDIILADGSDGEYGGIYKSIVKKFSSILNIDYRKYDPKVPLFERILDVLKNDSADYFIMSADDDYPLLDLLSEGEQFLELNHEYVSAIGGLVHLSLASTGKLSAKLNPARPIVSNNTKKRVINYSRWHFPTTYGVTRREHLLERYHRASRFFLSGFYDFTTGVHDCSVGKIKALEGIGYVCTKNYNHSYLRQKDKLFFLRRGTEILKTRDQFQSDLIEYGDFSDAQALAVADKLIKIRIAGLVNRGDWALPNFSNSPLFNDRVVKIQYDQFHGMFTDGHPFRSQAFDRLAHIAQGIQKVAISNDNDGDTGNYETLDDQLKGQNL